MTPPPPTTTKTDILVVDDIPDNIRFLASMLKEQGFNVRPAINGQIALRAVQATAPDLILLDINMPNMDGYAVCRQLKADPQTAEIPIIFLSALNDAQDKVKAFEAGGADYISKPFFVEEVLARINHQLQLYTLQRQLADRNQQLQNTLGQLQRTQSQLIQSEKMTALSQLVGGLAHELNNPVTFIKGNIAYARDYFKDLIDLVSLYQQEYPEPTPTVKTAIADLDLEFLYDDLQQVMQSMGAGAERIGNIVTGLQDFSRADEKGYKLAQIQNGLVSTLKILEYRLQPEGEVPITVAQNTADLPALVCNPGQLNQVFFHLLTNSIEAIRAQLTTSPPNYQPQIQIVTQATAEQITLEVTDNGVGIEPQHQPHIFEPFFTAKPIGQGSGLGLAIAYQIVVEEHQGELRCTSQPGESTTFTVQLPRTLPLS
ncbi:MAG: response regulator [Cyanobacteria bacterium P01_G01_bin.54]